jgi:hypothetical protein
VEAKSWPAPLQAERRSSYSIMSAAAAIKAWMQSVGLHARNRGEASGSVFCRQLERRLARFTAPLQATESVACTDERVDDSVAWQLLQQEKRERETHLCKPQKERERKIQKSEERT